MFLIWKPIRSLHGKSQGSRLLVGGAVESLDAKCVQLQEELAVAEHQKLVHSIVLVRHGVGGRWAIVLCTR